MSGPTVGVRAERREGVVIAHVTGEIDVATYEQAGEQIAALIGGAPAAVIDLSAVAFMDSSGMRLLDRLVEQAALDGTVLRVVADPGGRVRYVLRMTAFPGELLADDLGSAVAAVTPPPHPL